MAKLTQKDVWELILNAEEELKKLGKKIQPFNLADEVMDSIIAVPENKIKGIPLEVRQKLRNRFKKRYGW